MNVRSSLWTKKERNFPSRSQAFRISLHWQQMSFAFPFSGLLVIAHSPTHTPRQFLRQTQKDLFFRRFFSFILHTQHTFTAKWYKNRKRALYKKRKKKEFSRYSRCCCKIFRTCQTRCPLLFCAFFIERQRAEKIPFFLPLSLSLSLSLCMWFILDWLTGNGSALSRPR